MKTFRVFAHVLAATVVLVASSQLMGLAAFPPVSILTSLVLALTVSAGAFVLMSLLTMAICWPLKLIPGVLLHTVSGTVAGSLAIWIGALTFPQFVTVGFCAALPYAFANTMMIWCFAALTNSLRQDLHFLPERVRS